MPKKKSITSVTKRKATKKVAKKKVAKSAKKKASKKNKSYKSVKVSDDKVFFLIDGSTIASLQELVNVFDGMNDDIYYYHVTADRNDFANWVREVLKMEKLADALMNAQGALRAETTILRYLLKW